MNIINSPSATAIVISCLAIFSGLALFTGCSNDPVTEADNPRIEQVVIAPDNISFEVGEQVQFSAFLISESGDTVDTEGLNIEWEWWSSDPDVFDVEPGGTATGKSPGEEFCIVEVTVLVQQSNFSGRDSAFVLIF